MFQADVSEFCRQFARLTSKLQRSYFRTFFSIKWIIKQVHQAPTQLTVCCPVLPHSMICRFQETVISYQNCLCFILMFCKLLRKWHHAVEVQEHTALNTDNEQKDFEVLGPLFSRKAPTVWIDYIASAWQFRTQNFKDFLFIIIVMSCVWHKELDPMLPWTESTRAEALVL